MQSLTISSPRTAVICYLTSLVSLLALNQHLALARELQQATQVVGCRAAVPGCLTDICSLTQHGQQRWVCPRCRPTIYQRSQDGTRCDCRPGAYADCTNSSASSCLCKRCMEGYWCRGGRNAPNGAAAVRCPLNTITKRGTYATSAADCLVLPGYGWPSAAAAQPVKCAIGTYSTGYRDARTPCTTCPPGMTTLNDTSTSKYECVAYPGLYIDGGVTKACAQGTYQPYYSSQGVGACIKCNVGVTTAFIKSSAAVNCSVAAPGYGITICDASGCQAALCPKGYYNLGGPGSQNCTVCPWGFTTRAVGAASEDACVVPPGYGVLLPLSSDKSINRVVRCDYGYNPGWNRAACLSCGLNVSSLNNRTSALDCYVLQGQGLQMALDVRIRQAVDCWPGSVGMSTDTPALYARPCETCPRFMTTLQPLSSSLSACRALPGYTPQNNTDSVIGTPCPVGFYKPTVSNDNCTQCPANTSTTRTASPSLDNCTVCLPGFGGWQQSVNGTPSCSGPCQANSFNNGSFATCQPCPSGFISAQGASNCTVAPPVNCSGSWSAWTACSSPSGCGTGTISSTFIVTQPALYGGANCSVANGTVQTTSCSLSPCPINCQASYTAWSSCNATCGGGTRSRTYIISVDAAYGGTPCAAANNTIERESCNTQPCPVDCVGSWGAWGSCNATCGLGYQFSTYTITIAAANGGAACPFANGTVRSQLCSLPPCPVNCQASYTDWSSCNATCGGGTRSRTYIISVDAAYGGTPCAIANNTIERESCNTQPCPVDCVGSWGAWGSCNATCGVGYQSSTYTITIAAANGGAACPFANGTVRSQLCSLPACPVNCQATYTAWSNCTAGGVTVACGAANRTRTYVIQVQAANGGTACVAANNTVFTEACSLPVCNVDCVGAFSNSSCNATCGGGSLTSTFIISTPASGTGRACNYTNGSTLTLACNTQPCPVNCSGSWSSFATCNATCGGGWQSSTYTITQPALYGGAACPFSNNTLQWQQCNTQPCPINCTGSWGPWGNCSAVCAGGIQYSNYTITQQALFGGAACPATNGQIRNQSCNTEPCPIWPVSNCTTKPPTSMNITGLWCPTGLNNGGSWSPLVGGNSWSLPPGCIPSNGGCNSAGGQFAVKTDLLTTTVEGFTRCYCPEAQTKGHVIKLLPDGKLGCVGGAVFVPDNPLQPQGAGVWVDDVFNESPAPACNGSQSCWDMCFWCDGSPKYFSMTPAGQATGIRQYRNITTNCTTSQCWLTPTSPALSENTTFWQACDAFGAASMPRNNTALSTVNGQWPYRPGQTNYVNLFRLNQALPSGYVVNRGQQVINFWSPS